MTNDKRDLAPRYLWPIAFFLVAGFAAAADAQTATLQYRWTKGESRTYRMTVETTSAIAGMPNAGPITIVQTMTQTLKMSAEQVTPDGTATLSQTFQSVRVETNGPAGKVMVDTAAPGSSPDPMTQGMRDVLGAMVGESVVVVMAADGTVRRVEGAGRIADKITKVIAADPMAGAAGQGIRRMLSDDALKSTLEQSFPRLPAGPAKAGDTWTSQLAMGNEAIGRVTGVSTFTLKSIDDATAQIAVGLALKQEVVPAPSGRAGMVTQLRDGSGVGEILFDVPRGHIRRSTMRTEMTSSVTMNGPDGVPATMQNKTTTAMTMELVEK